MLTQVLDGVLAAGTLPERGIADGSAIVSLVVQAHPAVAALAAAVLTGENQQADAISQACAAVAAAPEPMALAKAFASQYADALLAGGMGEPTVKVRKSEFLAILKAVAECGFDPAQAGVKGVQALAKAARMARKGSKAVKAQKEPVDKVDRLCKLLREAMVAEGIMEIFAHGISVNVIGA